MAIDIFSMNTLLVLNLFLVPLLIGGITLAARRWGPAVGGLLSAFPVISAPILFFIALRHGQTFAADAALGTLSAVPANAVFAIFYAWCATRTPWIPSLAAGFAGYFLAVSCMNFWSPSLPVAIAFVICTLLIAPRLFPTMISAAEAKTASTSDIYWRMAAGAILVLFVTQSSAALGPRLSGSFAMFPVLAPVLAVFSHRQSGPAFAIQLLRGMAMGYYVFTTFCVVLSLTLPVTGIGSAFLLSLGSAVAAQVISHFCLRSTRQTSSPPVTER